MVEGVYDDNTLASARAATVSADTLQLQLPPESIVIDVAMAEQLLEPWLARSPTRGPLPDWFVEPQPDLSNLAFEAPVYWAPFVVLGAGFA
eukprot:m.403 g.403  ORF g.403 m.403 type:complete len:91 (-) comp134_c1_seq1:229-501(-)